MTWDQRVSVVMISRDRRTDVLNALRRNLALPERPRVIFVDNDSRDGTVAAVRARYPDVDAIALDRNRGAAARNAGAARARTPYLAFADDDSWWAPGALTLAADLLDAHPRLALINGHILVGADEHDDPTCVAMARSPLPAAPGQPGTPLLSFVACGTIVRRDALLAVGGFDERFGVGGEEELLGHRLAAAGWQQSYVPRIVAHHHPSPLRDPARRRAVALRNALWSTWLCRPLVPALRRTLGLLARTPPDRHSARGLGLALQGVPWVVREWTPAPRRVERARRLLDD